MGLASENVVILMGGVGADPEVFASEEGETRVAAFPIATTDRWKDAGMKKEKTQWHKCVAFGKMAEVCERYLRKGTHIYVKGSLINTTWKTADGQKRSGSRIRIGKLQILSGGIKIGAVVDEDAPGEIDDQE